MSQLKGTDTKEGEKDDVKDVKEMCFKDRLLSGVFTGNKKLAQIVQEKKYN